VAEKKFTLRVLLLLTSSEVPLQSREVADKLEAKIGHTCETLRKLWMWGMVKRVPKRRRNPPQQRPILYEITEYGRKKAQEWS
jgi:DNA-binding MarR family transcriptional regulator